MSGQQNCWNNIRTAANAKSEFADLKYEQMLGDKYFIETCFSKKYESYSPKQKLKDLWMEIIFSKC